MIKLYKCRLCGEVFGTGTVPENKSYLFMAEFASGSHISQYVTDRSAHYTDEHVGLADFVGLKYVFEDEGDGE